MKKIITIFLLFVSLSSFSQTPIIGGVYVSSNFLENDTLPYDSIEPILALRIDKILADGGTIEIKYRFGREAHMNIDYVFSEEYKCYKPIGRLKKMLFPPSGSLRKEVYIKINTPKELELFYDDNGIKRSYVYRYTYTDIIDYEKYRTPYYEEVSGFHLRSK